MKHVFTPNELKRLKQMYILMRMKLDEFIEYLIKEGYSLEEIIEILRIIDPSVHPDHIKKCYAQIVSRMKNPVREDEEKDDGTEPDFP